MCSSPSVGLLFSVQVHCYAMRTLAVNLVPQKWQVVLEWIAAGDEVQLTDHDQVVARLLPGEGTVKVVADADEPTAAASCERQKRQLEIAERIMSENRNLLAKLAE